MWWYIGLAVVALAVLGGAWFYLGSPSGSGQSSYVWILVAAGVSALTATGLFLWNGSSVYVAPETGEEPDPVTGLTPREEFERSVRVTSFVGAFFSGVAAILAACAIYWNYGGRAGGGAGVPDDTSSDSSSEPSVTVKTTPYFPASSLGVRRRTATTSRTISAPVLPADAGVTGADAGVPTAAAGIIDI